MERASKKQEVLDWRVAAALFLLATGMGAYLIGFLSGLMESAGLMVLSRPAVILAAPLVLVGGGLLLCDMGQKSKSYHLFSRPGSSWMSRGAYFTLLFFIFNLIHIISGIAYTTSSATYLTVGVIAAVLALLSLVYTGFLLGTVKAVPFWSRAFLPWLFLFSGLSTGAMAVSLLLSIIRVAGGAGPAGSISALAAFNFFVILLESILLASYLRAMKSTAPGSVRALTQGKLARPFWSGVVGAALILPLLIEALKAFVLSGTASLAVLGLIGGIIGLIGGYMLRHVIVYGGTRIPLNVRGRLVDPPPESYETTSIESAYQTFQKA